MSTVKVDKIVYKTEGEAAADKDVQLKVTIEKMLEDQKTEEFIEPRTLTLEEPLEGDILNVEADNLEHNGHILIVTGPNDYKRRFPLPLTKGGTYRFPLI